MIGTFFWVGVTTWTILIGSFLLFGIFQIRQLQQEMAKNEAHANFNKDQALRFWATMHGGVYVPVTDKTPPNPYLTHIKERDIKTPDGKALTLMNPAYMLRQVMEDHENLYGVRGHITSLKHFRPETAPDEWETSALQAFERGVKEISEFANMNGKSYFRYMAPISVQEGCLKCHGHQGYKVGDTRGGVSVSVPMARYLANQHRQTITYATALGFIWLLGLSGLIWAHRTIQQRMRQQQRAETELQTAHDELEQRVENRTRQLKDEIGRRKQTETRITAALKEKEVLLQEVHHRVKNNMSVTASLLKLQSSAITEPKVLKILTDTRARIKTMALIHDKLYRSTNLTHINFQTYVQDLVKTEFRTYGVSRDRISVKVAVEELFLEIDLATPCALIINELVSNAFKHAFPGNRKGEITVALSAINGDEAELIVTDDGVGFPADLDFENSELFGLYIIKLLVAQIEGTIDLDRDGGTTFRIRFKREIC